MRDYHGCSICGRKFPEDALTLFAGDYFCEHCLDEETVVCADCGTRLWNDSNAGADDHPLCQRCYDRTYTTCERCGRLSVCRKMITLAAVANVLSAFLKGALLALELLGSRDTKE